MPAERLIRDSRETQLGDSHRRRVNRIHIHKQMSGFFQKTKKTPRVYKMRRSHRKADSTTSEMLLKGLILLVISQVSLAHQVLEQWPFEIADRFMEDFKSKAETLEKLAHHYHMEEQNSGGFSWDSLNETHIHKDDTKYDFIIIGGGTSGAVLATRLSEVPEWKVLLLEAGGFETQASQVPNVWKSLENTPFNWGYTTVPQNSSCLGMKNHQCSIPQGRVLGGTSAINSMVYTRGNSRDYDLWSDRGDKGWCYDEVLPYFKKIEDAYFTNYDHKYHHRGGPQPIQNPAFLTHFADDVIEAGRELHLPHIDYNGKHQVGVGIPQLTTNYGRRYSTAQSYLSCKDVRPNLVIKPFTHVLKLAVSFHTKDVKGALYLHEGKVYEVNAEKEVILAAGALNTPKILLQSGIGSKDELEKHKIEQLVDLKVGHNLRANPIFLGLDFVQDNHSQSSWHHAEIKYSDVDYIDYLRHGKGQLSTPGVEAIAFIKSEMAKKNIDYPDVELQFRVDRYLDPEDKIKSITLSKDQCHDYWKLFHGKTVLNVAVILRHPKSVGCVKLHSHDPLEAPLIDPQLLQDEDEHDLKALLGGVRKVLKLAHEGTFKRHGFNLNHSPVLGECEHLEFDSDEYWCCAIKHLTGIADVSGTARMGQEHDKEAVVDHHLKVLGVNNLRIADASVIPVDITGGLTAATILIGERAADLIKHDWE